MGIVYSFIIGIVTAIVLTIFYAAEAHDKRYRSEHDLPPRRYHDLTDIDYTCTTDMKPRK